MKFLQDCSITPSKQCIQLIQTLWTKMPIATILSVYPIVHLKRRNVTDIVENSYPLPWPDDHYHPIMQGIFGKGCDPLVKRSHDLLNIRCLQPIWRWSSGRTPYFIFLICILPYFVPSLWLLVARMVSTSAVHLSVSNFGDIREKWGHFVTCPKPRQA